MFLLFFVRNEVCFASFSSLLLRDARHRSDGEGSLLTILGVVLSFSLIDIDVLNSIFGDLLPAAVSEIR